MSTITIKNVIEFLSQFDENTKCLIQSPKNTTNGISFTIHHTEKAIVFLYENNLQIPKLEKNDKLLSK